MDLELKGELPTPRSSFSIFDPKIQRACYLRILPVGRKKKKKKEKRRRKRRKKEKKKRKKNEKGRRKKGEEKKKKKKKRGKGRKNIEKNSNFV